MRPMFSFFGSKWRIAHHYPPPLEGVPVIEPFAGGACYSLRHNVREAVLVEKDPEIAELWRYLIAATPAQIRALPDIHAGQKVADLEVAPGAAALIGFWLGQATTAPGRTGRDTKWTTMNPASFWGPQRRDRVAAQVANVDGWRVIEGDYSGAPDLRATWHIDPPYQHAGKHYRCSSGAINFDALARWCRSRRGRVMVCEASGADWLPFQPLAAVKATTHRSGEGRTSREVIWHNKGPVQVSLWS